MPVRKMRVSDWIRIQDNPIQRDTERHAARATHLMTPLPIHAIVFAAELPDRKLVKLDGHTRALLWSRNQVRHPPELECHIIQVESMDEAIHLYQTLDSQQAVETIKDKVSGAFGQHNFKPASGLMKAGNVANALRLVWNVAHGKAITGSGGVTGGQHFSIYDAIDEFSPELFALDSYNLGSGQATSGIVSAFILTNRKHGAAVLPFWNAVFGDGGEKKAGRMDGVQALNELILQRRGKAHGGSGVADMACRAVAACEKWLKDEDFGSIPRPYDVTNYITERTRAEVRLIKGTGHDKRAAA